MARRSYSEIIFGNRSRCQTMTRSSSHPVMTGFFWITVGFAVLGALSLIQAAFAPHPRDLEMAGYPFYLFVIPSFLVGMALALVTVLRWRSLTKSARWMGILSPFFAVACVLIGVAFDALFYGR